MSRDRKITYLLQILKQHRKSNPIFSRDIEHIVGSSGASIRDWVRELRRKGEVIVAGKDGYYYVPDHDPEFKKEARIVIQDLTERIRSMQKTIAVFERRIEERGGSQHRFDFAAESRGVQELAARSAAPVFRNSEGESSLTHTIRDRVQSVPVHHRENTHGSVSGNSEDVSFDELLQSFEQTQ